MGITIVFCTVPQHLHQTKGELLVNGVGVSGIEQSSISIKVHTALQQGAVIHAGHPQSTAMNIWRHSHDSPTIDTALAITVIKHMTVINQGSTIVSLESRMANETVLRF